MMGESRRPVLRLRGSVEDNCGEPAGQPEETSALGALNEIAQLRRRLDIALSEIDQLRRRTENLRRGTALNRAEFFKRLADRMAGDEGARACLVRVAVSNADDILGEHNDEALEEVCVTMGHWLAGHVRGTDFVGRVGMATFAIYFGFADPAAIKEKMARLKSRIETAPVDWQNRLIRARIDIEVEDVGVPDANA